MEPGQHIPSIEEQRAAVVFLPGAPKVKPGASEFEIKYFTELHGLMVNHARMGIEPATVINLNPFELQVHSPLFRGLTVSACPVDKAFTMMVIREPRFQARDNEGVITPVDFLPIILAKEFETQFANGGGVFVFRGDGEKIAKQTDGDLMQNELFREFYADAKRKLIITALQKVQEADNEWNTPSRSGARNITDLHRGFHRILLRERRLSKPKEWLDATRDEAQIGELCPSCGNEPRKGAALCNTCGWVMDPLKAWTIGAVTDPMHNSLSRLKRAVLDSLGITREHIPETIEERDARLRAAAAPVAEAPKPTGNQRAPKPQKDADKE